MLHHNHHHHHHHRIMSSRHIAAWQPQLAHHRSLVFCGTCNCLSCHLCDWTSYKSCQHNITHEKSKLTKRTASPTKEYKGRTDNNSPTGSNEAARVATLLLSVYLIDKRTAKWKAPDLKFDSIKTSNSSCWRQTNKKQARHRYSEISGPKPKFTNCYLRIYLFHD